MDITRSLIVGLLFISAASIADTTADIAADTSKAGHGLEITDQTFTCIRDMSKVRGFYVGSLTDDLEQTLAVANTLEGGTYPAGSVVQLVPGEVMVKHPKGFSIATNDWEFFELDVSSKGSKIRKRGFVDVVNRFGGNCFGCHIKAKPQFGLVCEGTHGCDPIPLGKDMLALLQKTDPRCDDNETLTPVEQKKMQMLQAFGNS